MKRPKARAARSKVALRSPSGAVRTLAVSAFKPDVA